MRRKARRQFTATLILVCGLAACSAPRDAVLVLAAASTIDAMEAAANDFSATTGVVVEVSFGSTSVLARQIEEGAPADLFLSASAPWADHVGERVPWIERRVIGGNRIVVVAAASTPVGSSLEELAANPAIGRIAVADPLSVPAGMYAAEALRSAGVWETVSPRLIPAINVRAALRLVTREEVDAGLVYATDAAAAPDLRVAFSIDPRLHTTIEYPLLLLRDARPGARLFFEYLLSERGRTHFRDRGFTVADF